ncbi:Ig-like domain-containing protein [Nocardioides sp.]|uniref:Ig-like domain-containing protein n=1 Tax=Nocardioides sp. TaxID=35761 RepID=UPI0026220B1A|nr:Ig-like domain-containing protein [Nocardioides sp.]
MRFRKIASLASGALAAAALSVPMLSAPAHAATNVTLPVTSNCTYNTYSLPWNDDIAVTIDGTSVTAVIDTPFNLGAASIYLSAFGGTLALRIDDQLVKVSAKSTFSRIPANQDFVAPTLTGTLAYAPSANPTVQVQSLSADMTVDVNTSGTNWISASASAVCTGSGITPEPVAVYASCTYGTFPSTPWNSIVDFTVNGTAVSASIRSKVALGFSSITLQEMGAVIQANVDGQSVTLHGKESTGPSGVPGNTFLKAPVLTGTLPTASTATTHDIYVEKFAMDLTLFNMSAEAPCAGSGIAATTTSTLTATTSAPRTVKLAVVVAPAAAGKVEFYDGATKVGEKNISATGSSAGKGTLDLTDAAAGSRSYTAKFIPNVPRSFNGSVSDAQALEVAALATTTTGTATSPAPGAVSFTATVTPAEAAGTVEFYDGATKVAEGTVASGAVSASAPLVAAGAHSFVAKFVPADATVYAPSESAAAAVTVEAIASTTALTATSPAPGKVTLAASVTPTDAAGTVAFFEGTTQVGQASVADGKASVALTGVAAGAHSYTATFTSTSGAYAVSTSAAAAVTVAKIPVVVLPKATASAVKVAYNKKKRTATITVTVKAGATAATGAVKVSVKVGKKQVITKTVTLKGGTATIKLTKKNLKKKGKYSVSSVYAANGSFKGSAATKTFNVK